MSFAFSASRFAFRASRLSDNLFLILVLSLEKGSRMPPPGERASSWPEKPRSVGVVDKYPKPAASKGGRSASFGTIAQFGGSNPRGSISDRSRMPMSRAVRRPFGRMANADPAQRMAITTVCVDMKTMGATLWVWYGVCRRMLTQVSRGKMGWNEMETEVGTRLYLYINVGCKICAERVGTDGTCARSERNTHSSSDS